MSATRALAALREIDPIEFPIFADLLTRVSRFQPLTDHAYAGMSGFAADDQKKLYRTLGLRRMLSFDPRIEVVARQRFNRPIQDGRARIATFQEFASDWRQAMIEEGFEEATNYILWVRGGSTEEIGREARHFQQMVGALPENGIARITLEVRYDEWTGPLHAEGRRRTVSDLQQSVRERLGDYLADFLQTGDLAGPLDEDGLCRMLAKAFGTAAGTAVPGATGQVFEPLSIVRYGSPACLTISGMVVANARRDALRSFVDAGDWPFSSRSWTELTDLRFPDLTLKERIELEAAGGNRTAALAQLHFDLDSATENTGLFDSFVRYHRFFPTTVTAEI